MALCLLSGLLLPLKGSAQAWSQNFDSGIPSGWILHNVDGNTPASATSFVTDAWVSYPRTGSYAGNNCIVATTQYQPAGTGDDWIVTPPFTVTNKMRLTWMEYDGFMTPNSNAYRIMLSTGGSNPSDFTTTLFQSYSNRYQWDTVGVGLSPYAGQTIRLAFRSWTADRALCGIDDAAAVELPYMNDISIDSAGFPSILPSTDTGYLKFYFRSKGATRLDDMKLRLVLDGTEIGNESWSAMGLDPFFRAFLTFSLPVTGTSPGPHTLKVEVVTANNAPDSVTGNNALTVSFTTPSQNVPRAGLVEEFTSSTCAPCAAFNAMFDPLLVANNANQPASRFNVIKYQMGWPSPGNDPSLNAHGQQRTVMYGVSGIPDHYVNGKYSWEDNQAMIDASKSKPAFVQIEGAYKVGTDSLFADIKVTPYLNMSEPGRYRVFMAVTENHYSYPGAYTTQKEYYYVMRRMLPDHGGVAFDNWTDGVARSFKLSAPYTNGGAAQFNHHFWTSANNSTLVVFVQDMKTKQVLQSAAFVPQGAAGASNIGPALEFALYPNPAVDMLYLRLQSPGPDPVTVELCDLSGRVLQQKTFPTRATSLSLPVAELPRGTYVLKLVQGATTGTTLFSLH